YNQGGDFTDLVMNLQSQVKNCCDCIKTLELDAHGSPNSIDGISGKNVAAVGKQLKDDVKFCSPCVIYLAGCNTALGPISQQLANATGCTVYGSLGYLSGTHAEGNETITKETTINGVHYAAVPGSKEAKGSDSWQAFYPGGKVPAAVGACGKKKGTVK